MDPSIRLEDDALNVEDQVLDAPEIWEFYAAVRALAACHPDGPGVGRSTRIEDDRIQFRQKPSLRMEASEISSAERVHTEDGDVMELTQVFFGPFGPHGALPEHITEDAIEAARRGSTDLQDFTDLFTHRMTALLYRAWETTQIAVNRDRGAEDLYQIWLNALFGQGQSAFRDRDGMPDDAKRFMAGWMSNPRGSVQAIEAVLEFLIGAPVEVTEFVPEWLPISLEDQAKLGVAPARLGRDILIGRHSYSVQSRLRIRTAKLTQAQFNELLPDGSRHKAVRDAVRNLLGLGPGWELQLVLDGQQVPRLCLDGTRRLGWDSWAIEEDRFSDAVDVLIEGTYSNRDRSFETATSFEQFGFDA